MSVSPPRGVHTEAALQITCPVINSLSCVFVFSKLLSNSNAVYLCAVFAHVRVLA